MDIFFNLVENIRVVYVSNYGKFVVKITKNTIENPIWRNIFLYIYTLKLAATSFGVFNIATC